MQLVKLAVSVFAFIAVAALAAGSAVAGPIFGEYTSTDMGGTVNVGRWSEGDVFGSYAPGNWGHAQD